jgi:putative endonuclease
MANKLNGVIFIDVTNNIDEKVREHKFKVYPRSFTAKYNCDKLL